MVFDPHKLLAMDPLVTHHDFTPRDTMLYALGVGASELSFIYEQQLKALPTMAVVMAYPGFFWQRPELEIDWKRILHAEQSIELHAPLPIAAKLRGETRIEAIFDKGAEKGAIAYGVRQVIDEGTGQHLATVSIGTFLRGNGGHGGSDGAPPRPHGVPDRPADERLTLATATGQAAIYRLSGDYNPLHIDPTIAQAAGFPRPILHGLCTYGVAGRAVLKALCNNEPERLKRLDVRFSSPVFPGETIETEIWREGEGRAAFRSRVRERDVLVLNNGYVEFQ